MLLTISGEEKQIFTKGLSWKKTENISTMYTYSFNTFPAPLEHSSLGSRLAK